jgi:hypothetical protein
MSSLSIVLVVSALSATSGQATPSAEQQLSSGQASLSFVSKDQVLVGTVYGIAAIDAQPRVYGQHLSANVSAGQRTVWYSCPNSPQASNGSNITFDFVAGHQYELVCQPAEGAMIRLAEKC